MIIIQMFQNYLTISISQLDDEGNETKFAKLLLRKSQLSTTTSIELLIIQIIIIPANQNASRIQSDLN